MIDIAWAVHESSTVRKATADEAETLAAILGRAFYDDPVMRWVIFDDRRRSELLQRSFGLYLRKLWLKQDECYTTASSVGAASSSPARTPVTFLWPMSCSEAATSATAEATPAQARTPP